MNLLLMQQANKISGLPRNGLISLIDPYRDLYGRNILPAGSENFVTGWVAQSGEGIAVTGGQLDPFSGNNAYHIQGNGLGTNVLKYHSASSPVVPLGVTCAQSVWVKAKTSTPVLVLNNLSGTNIVTQADGWKQCKLNPTSDGAGISLVWLKVSNATDILSCDIYQPQVNLGTLYPYSAPAGLPQSANDYSNHGNSFQNGSTSGADTNDASWSGNGVVIGTDDYLKSSSPVFDDLQQFTVITVCKANSAGGSNVGRMWDKSAGSTKGHACAVDAGKPNLYLYATEGMNMQTFPQAVVFGSNSIIGIAGNIAIPKTAFKGYINSIKQVLTVTGIGNTIIKDNDADLYIGNRQDAIRNFDGTIYLQAWYNRILTDAEYMQAYNSLKRLMNQRGVVI